MGPRETEIFPGHSPAISAEGIQERRNVPGSREKFAFQVGAKTWLAGNDLQTRGSPVQGLCERPNRRSTPKQREAGGQDLVRRADGKEGVGRCSKACPRLGRYAQKFESCGSSETLGQLLKKGRHPLQLAALHDAHAGLGIHRCPRIGPSENTRPLRSLLASPQISLTGLPETAGMA